MKKTGVGAIALLMLFFTVPGPGDAGEGLTILYSGGVNGWFSGMKG